MSYFVEVDDNRVVIRLGHTSRQKRPEGAHVIDDEEGERLRGTVDFGAFALDDYGAVQDNPGYIKTSEFRDTTETDTDLGQWVEGMAALLVSKGLIAIEEIPTTLGAKLNAASNTIQTK